MPPFILAVVGFCGILFVLRLSFPYLAPFFFGLSLAFVMDIPVSFLESKGWSRSVTSLILAVLSFLLLPALVTLFLLKLWEEVERLSGFLNLFSLSANAYSEHFVQLFEALPILDTGIGMQTLIRWALAIPDLFLIWTITAVSAYFFCRDKRILAKFLARQLPRLKGFSPRQIYQDASGALWHFVQVQLVLMLLSTTVSMIFFVILDLPYALLSGFLVGFFDLCPILGPGLVYFFLAMIQLWMGNTFTAIALGVGYLILLLLRQWGEPHLVSERLGLHPLVALVGLYAGFRFWGPLGAVVGPVLMVFLKAFLRGDSVHR